MGNPLNHRPRKRFGQNFLHDQYIVNRIIEAIAPRKDEKLVEIGPGRGAITHELLRAVGCLQAVELDRDLIQPLQTMCSDVGELRVYNCDALKFDFCSLSGGEPLRIVGNLPYNISTPILFHLLDQRSCILDMHIMLQKEVVQRMAARPGSKSYGRLSVMVQTYCEVEPLFEIGPGAFHPPPKVDSAFVRLTPYPTPVFHIKDPRLFAQLVASAFSQRRKTLRNSLKGTLTPEQMQIAGVDPALRAERLEVADFVQLANCACNTSDVT